MIGKGGVKSGLRCVWLG